MSLPDNMVKKLRDHGLYVSGPWKRDEHGRLARRAVSSSPPIMHNGISILTDTVVWIYEDNGAWVAEKHEIVPGPGPTDFRRTYATADEAVARILQFFDRHENHQSGCA
jgi:hypothetical protein